MTLTSTPLNHSSETMNISSKATITFKTKNGLQSIEVVNKHCSAKILVYGAQVLSFKPHTTTDLLWESKITHYAEGKPVRGGIPLCFPWFGPHQTDRKLPAHGFVRTAHWTIESITDLDDESTRLVLTFASSDHTRTLWPFSFTAKVVIIAGISLDVTLHYTNTDTAPFTVTAALHSYFNISSIENIAIDGLHNKPYLQGVDSTHYETQFEELLPITKEENRRYNGHDGTCTIIDKGFNRKIIVGKRHSNCTVVWNPWIESTRTFADMEPDGYKTMICVEPSNISDYAVVLKPGESSSISTIVAVEML
jgi:D-hexose-6-phosphate mutarotase